MTRPGIEMPEPGAWPRLHPTGAKALKWAVVAALAVIVATTFSSALAAAWDRLREEPVAPSWQLALAVALFAAAVLLSGVLWGRILQQLSGRSSPKAEAAAAHSLSWVLKYVPGQVGSLVYKVIWGKARGIAAPAVMLSFVYENLFLQIASLVPAAIILPLALDKRVFASSALTLALLVAGSIVAVLFSLGPGLRWLMRMAAKRYPVGALHTLSLRQCLVHAMLFAFPRLFNAAGFVLIVVTIAPVAPGDWLPLGSIYVLAGAIGILAVFVPSGLGVREAVIILLAREIIGEPDAIIAAVVARLLSIVSDGVVMLLYPALKAGRSKVAVA